jgi:hypothetical protein
VTFLLSNNNSKRLLLFSKKIITTLYINQTKTAAIMDYVLSTGMAKMPKIPDKNNSRLFLITHLEKRFQTGNLILP